MCFGLVVALLSTCDTNGITGGPTSPPLCPFLLCGSYLLGGNVGFAVTALLARSLPLASALSDTGVSSGKLRRQQG